MRRRRDEVFGAVPQRESTGTAVRAKSTPTDPVTVVDTETERLLRDRLAELRPGEHVLGEEGGGRSDDSAGRADLGARPHRRHGELRLRASPAYAVSVAVQRRRRRRWPGPSPTSPPARCTPRRVGHGAHVRRGTASRRRCGAVGRRAVDVVGGHRIRATRPSSGQRQARGPGDAAAAGPRRATDRLVRAGPVHGGRRASSTPTTRTAQRVGLGGGCADRRRGGCPRAAAAGERDGGSGTDRRGRAGHRRGARRRVARLRARWSANDVHRNRIAVSRPRCGSSADQRRIGRLGGVRPQAGQHGVDVVAVGQLGELGADRQVDGVVAALVLEQLGARRDQPDRRRGRAPGRAEADLALALQPVVRVHRVVGRCRIGEPEVAQLRRPPRRPGRPGRWR